MLAIILQLTIIVLQLVAISVVFLACFVTQTCIGKIEPVAGTTFDFMTPHRIGEHIKEVPGFGYDHNYCMKTEICKYHGSDLWLCAWHSNMLTCLQYRFYFN